MKKICPECGEEISKLLQSAVVKLDIELCVDGEDIFVGDRLEGGWRCPVCGALVFWTFNEAAHFLGCEMTYDV